MVLRLAERWARKKEMGGGWRRFAHGLRRRRFFIRIRRNRFEKSRFGRIKPSKSKTFCFLVRRCQNVPPFVSIGMACSQIAGWRSRASGGTLPRARVAPRRPPNGAGPPSPEVRTAGVNWPVRRLAGAARSGKRDRSRRPGFRPRLEPQQFRDRKRDASGFAWFCLRFFAPSGDPAPRGR